MMEDVIMKKILYFTEMAPDDVAIIAKLVLTSQCNRKG